MSLGNITNFRLDMVPGGAPPIIHVSAGDVGRPYRANLYWNSVTYDIQGNRVTIEGAKPDGTVFKYNVDDFDRDDSWVDFTVKKQMAIVPGKVRCKLIEYLNDDKIGSATFIMDVDEDVFNPDALSESDVYTLTELVTDAIGDAITTALENNMIDTAHIDNLAVTTAKVAANAITWEKLAVAVQNRITTLESSLTDLEARLSSGDEDDAGLHLGFYIDTDGDLCQVD